jgi:hypothetical protein
MRVLAFVLLLAAPGWAAACDYPDEGNMPLHRAVTKVKLLPETEAWSAELLTRKVIVQYVLSLDRDVKVKGRCYWTVEARAGGVTWRRFLVRPETGDPLPAAAR